MMLWNTDLIGIIRTLQKVETGFMLFQNEELKQPAESIQYQSNSQSHFFLKKSGKPLYITHSIKKCQISQNNFEKEEAA